jgi:hypothetical protein
MTDDPITLTPQQIAELKRQLQAANARLIAVERRRQELRDYIGLLAVEQRRQELQEYIATLTAQLKRAENGRTPSQS